jgi:hypothetical protein
MAILMGDSLPKLETIAGYRNDPSPSRAAYLAECSDANVTIVHQMGGMRQGQLDLVWRCEIHLTVVNSFESTICACHIAKYNWTNFNIRY